MCKCNSNFFTQLMYKCKFIKYFLQCLIYTYTIYTLHIHVIYPLHAQHCKKTNPSANQHIHAIYPLHAQHCQKTNPNANQQTNKKQRRWKPKLHCRPPTFFSFISCSRMPMHTLSSLSLSLCDLTPEPAWDCKSISSSVQYVTLQNIYIYISHIQV
jgi:hypothetical protein